MRKRREGKCDTSAGLPRLPRDSESIRVVAMQYSVHCASHSGGGHAQTRHSGLRSLSSADDTTASLGLGHTGVTLADTDSDTDARSQPRSASTQTHRQTVTHTHTHHDTVTHKPLDTNSRTGTHKLTHER